MAKRAKPQKKPSPGLMPQRIFAQVSPRSVGGVSIFESLGVIDATTVDRFRSERRFVDEAANRLLRAGFEILQVTDLTVNIAGTQKTYEQAFGKKLVTEERPVIKEFGRADTATFIECPETSLPGLVTVEGTVFEEVVEGVAIEVPYYYFAASPLPPPAKYWHLDVPADVSLATNADRAHRAGITGKGVRVAMVDSGHFKHPFFTARGYRVAPVVLGPGAADPLRDESGHGTGESANIFAVAPDAELLPVKMSFVNATGAFNAAAALRPDIITCSWGSDICVGPLTAANQALAAAVAAAWAAGIVVIFAAGNGHAGFPAQHPDTIAAGGVFRQQNDSLRASDYASGFASSIYPGRRVPDLCGLVGMKPGAMYIMLPVEPGDDIDRGNSGGSHPNGDETGARDGWAAFSGTSAAAPQLAGASALVKQACPRLTPPAVREILMRTAQDVTTGNSNIVCGTVQSAGPGVDGATGHGLVDAHKAALFAKVRCLRRPPGLPIPPGKVLEPPIRPEPRRYEPAPAPLEAAPLEAETAAPLTSEDVRALEDMIVESGINFGNE